MKTRLQFSLPTFRASFFGALLAMGCIAPLFASACSGDETTPAPGSGPIPIDSIRSEYLSARCDFLTRCGQFPDAKTCLDLNGTDQEVLQLIADVVYGTVAYDPAAARTCISALKGLGCELLPSQIKAFGDACEGVFKGSVPEGGGCVTDQECEGKGTCDKEMCMGNGACCIGKCVAEVPPVPLGGDCSMAVCVPEAYCDQGDGQGGAMPTCTARNDNGQQCKQKDACLEGQRCDTSGDNTCYKLSAEGQQCNPTISNGSCLRTDNWCDTTEKKCVKLPGAGMPCADVNGDMECLGYAYCDMMTMTCKSRPVEGEACQQQGGPNCLGSLYCGHDDMTMMDTCTRPQPSAVCVLDSQKP